MTLYALSERARITTIGTAVEGGATVGFVVEDDEKADRYLQQLHERFSLRVIHRGVGPIPNTVLVQVGPMLGFGEDA